MVRNFSAQIVVDYSEYPITPLRNPPKVKLSNPPPKALEDSILVSWFILAMNGGIHGMLSYLQRPCTQ